MGTLVFTRLHATQIASTKSYFSGAMLDCLDDITTESDQLPRSFRAKNDDARSGPDNVSE